MFRLKLESGDAVERQEAEWIRLTIPLYEDIWGRYIGNDGSNRALELRNASPGFSKQRDRFNQCHYSILISLLILRSENERYQQSCGQMVSVDSYLETIRDLTGFMAQVGRLRDLFESISNLLGLGTSLWLPFDDLYKSRSAVIHGAVVPFQIEDGLVLVPSFETSTQQNSVWSSKAVWGDCELSHFTPLSDYMRLTFESACKLTSASYSHILTQLKNLMPDATLLIKHVPPASDMIPITAGSTTIYLPRGSGIQ